jgi:predicted acyl esterase
MFVFCKWKWKTEVLLGQQRINGDQQLLFQQACPSMHISSVVEPEPELELECQSFGSGSRLRVSLSSK